VTSEDEKAHEQKRGLPGNARIGLAEIKEAAKVAPALFKIALDGAGAEPRPSPSRYRSTSHDRGGIGDNAARG
jgi:hypothetical protein